MAKEEIEVVVEFPKLTEQTREYYYSALRLLARAGISFPTQPIADGIEWDFGKLKGGKVYRKEKK